MMYEDSHWRRHSFRFSSARTSEFERTLGPLLDEVFGEHNVKMPWRPMLPEERRGWNGDGVHRQLTYAPVLDIAVGPFATHGVLSDLYDGMEREYLPLLDRLLWAHQENTGSESRFTGPTHNDLQSANHNPRCFLAIELENGLDPKHHLGSVVNAVALGRIPVLVGLNKKSYASLLRLREYILQLDEYRKNVFNAEAMLVLSGEQLLAALQGTANSIRR